MVLLKITVSVSVLTCDSVGSEGGGRWKLYPNLSGIVGCRERILALDKNGLPVADFDRMFSRCACGLVMTRRVFVNHDCAAQSAYSLALSSTEVVDLTGNSSD